jgi:hypothetical protein
MNGRHVAAAVGVAYVAATVVAAMADATAPSTSRALSTAVLEAVPALLLAALTLRGGGTGPRPRGAVLFAVAMALLAGAVVVTSGTHTDDVAPTVGALLAVTATLAAAYLRVLSASRRQAAAAALLLLLLPGLLAVLASLDAVSLASTTRAGCGVDSCAFNGLGIAFALAVACECALLVALIPALATGLRAGLGVVLFGVGTNLLLVVALQWSQYQGVMGVAFGYAGLALIALPWLAPREHRPGEPDAATPPTFPGAPAPTDIPSTLRR